MYVLTMCDVLSSSRFHSNKPSLPPSFSPFLPLSPALSLPPSLSLQSCADIIVGGCQYYVCDVKPGGVVTIVNVMARLVQIYPNHFAQVIPNLLSTVIKNLLKEEVTCTHYVY